MPAHGSQFLDIFRELFAPDLHLDGTVAAFDIAFGLGNQLRCRKVKIDTACIARNGRIIAAKQFPQRQSCALRLQIPKGDVERRKRQHRWSAAPAIMGCPPDLFPELFDEIGIVTLRDCRDLAAGDIVDCTAIVPAGERVADP